MQDPPHSKQGWKSQKPVSSDQLLAAPAPAACGLYSFPLCLILLATPCWLLLFCKCTRSQGPCTDLPPLSPFTPVFCVAGWLCFLEIFAKYHHLREVSLRSPGCCPHLSVFPVTLM